MNLLFFDSINWDYDVATPLERPLGGSQSALAYLSVELARRGHQVFAATGTSQPRQVLGVNCVSFRHLPEDALRQPWDAVVVLNGPAELSLRFRPLMPPHAPLVLWTQHAHDQSAMFGLANPEVRAAWDIVVCMSSVHRNQMIAHYRLDPFRTIVLQNGIAPAFENLFASPDELAKFKGEQAILAYTSTPFRGLDMLLSVFPRVLQRHPETLLRIFSSMKVYSTPLEQDQYRSLYDWARATPNVEYIGSLSQTQLAAELRTAAFLAYPNTFAEMYCISIIEAMAAGLFVVTTDLGALPETLMGHGTLVRPVASQADVPAFLERYAARLNEEIALRAHDPQAFAARQFAQVQLVNQRCNYRTRASQWESSMREWPILRLHNTAIA